MFVSKYALTGGVVEMDGKVVGEYFHAEGRWGLFKVGRDAHNTREEANAAAEVMRVKKIKSLEKQIKQLEKLQFTT